MKSIARYLLFVLLLASSCQPKFDMVPPGTRSSAPEFSENWYVTQDGAGLKNGYDWNNALSISAFFNMISASDASYANSAFHIREGRYLMTNANAIKILTRDVGCIRGGYSASLTYADLSACDPNLYPTVFTGDVNNNGQADEGDGAFAYVQGGNLRFENIRFEKFYLSKAAAAALGGEGSAVFGINGPYLSTSVLCRNCIFEGNVNAEDAAAAREGGPCVFLNQGYFKATGCIFRSNAAHSRGGALRINKKLGVAMLDRCLFSDNHIDDQYGSAIQVSAGNLCMNNTTLVDNVGNGSTLNGGGAFLIVNSTLIDGAEPSPSNAAFRCESTGDAHTTIINSVFSSTKAEGAGLLLNNGVILSKGFNLIKKVVLSGTSVSPVREDDTVKDEVLSGALEGLCWKWDIAQVQDSMNGYAIVDEVYDASTDFDSVNYSSISVLGRSYASWITPQNFFRDARGSVRGDERFQPGAYDPNID